MKKAPGICAILFLLAACSPSQPGSMEPTSAPIVVEEATIANTEPTLTLEPAPVVEGGINACSLINQSEAEHALGTSTGTGQRDDSPPLYSCSYETGSFDLVQVILVVYDSEQQANDAFQMGIDINGYPEIGELGDRAYNAQPILDVDVLKGIYELSIDVSDSSDDETQLQKAIELARIALTRLP